MYILEMCQNISCKILEQKYDSVEKSPDWRQQSPSPAIALSNDSYINQFQSPGVTSTLHNSILHFENYSYSITNE